MEEALYGGVREVWATSSALPPHGERRAWKGGLIQAIGSPQRPQRMVTELSDLMSVIIASFLGSLLIVTCKAVIDK